MRWVVPGGACEEDEIESSDDGGADTPAAASGSRGGGGSDDDDDGYEEDEMLRQRLVRTGPRADSFDVEALDVPGVYRHQVRAIPPSHLLRRTASWFSVPARCLWHCLREPAPARTAYRLVLRARCLWYCLTERDRTMSRARRSAFALPLACACACAILCHRGAEGDLIGLEW